MDEAEKSAFYARYAWAITITLDGCWEWGYQQNGHWIGTRTPDGYGKLTINGRKLLAHRVAYTLDVGVLEDGQVVMHDACDNPPCCRPSHLKAGTQEDNIRDAWAKGHLKGRWQTGIRS